ncbi:hypothetical protein KR044_008548, partial [Drosophila immigrans]
IRRGNIMNKIIIFFVLWQVMSTHCRDCNTSEVLVRLLDCPQLMYISREIRESYLSNVPKKYCCPPNVELRITEPMEDPKFPEDCGYTPWYESYRVVGGQVIQPDEFSWLVWLEYAERPSDAGICGGSIINSRYVLTAAHCVIGRAVEYYGGVVAVRMANFTNEPKCDYGTNGCQQYQRIGVEQVVLHGKYIVDNRTRMLNDISLLRLRKRIEFTSMLKPICLPFGNNLNIPEPISQSPLEVAGWGKTLSREDDVAKRAVSVPMWSKEKCLEEPLRDESQICVGITGKGSCNGDSGGPVMYLFESKRMVLEGIISYGDDPCAYPDRPGVATRVRSFSSWIERNMRM